MADHYYALIMAGGGGTRLWPMSRKKTPKQLLSLINDRTMFKTSAGRLSPLFNPDHIYVIAGPEYMDALRNETPSIPAENFIVEPHGRNTAPAAALGISVVYKRDPQATVALLTADHYIGKEGEFRMVLETAYHVAQEDYIVTLGIEPTYPATGFGYIQQGEKLQQIGSHVCYKSLGFTEKPSIEVATGFLASGQYSWNSGMFIWRAERAMQEFQQQQPQMYRLMQTLLPAVDTPGYQDMLDSMWEKMPKTSIDFAIMEGVQQMVVIPTEIGWSDVGSWSALFDVHTSDQLGNCFDHAPDRIVLDTRNTMAFSDRLVVTIGVEDLIIIDTDDALLICQNERTQDVKDVVDRLRDAKRDQYL